MLRDIEVDIGAYTSGNMTFCSSKQIKREMVRFYCCASSNISSKL